MGSEMYTTGPTSRHVLPPGKYMIEDIEKLYALAGCHYVPSDIIFCQVTLAQAPDFNNHVQ